MVAGADFDSVEGLVFGAVAADVLGALVVVSPVAAASWSCLASVAAAAPRADSTALPSPVLAWLASLALAVAGVAGVAGVAAGAA